MADLHSLPPNSRPDQAIRNNGPDKLALERFKLRELAEGWPMYRDACEWENFKSLFHPDAYVYTTWSGRIHYLDFIASSQQGMDKGAFIMHRCYGISTDINAEATRAVTKMKAAITQRFMIDGCDVDAESDCRFCFFWVKTESGAWCAKYVRHWYEKDKLIPVNPSRVPALDEDHLSKFPNGYRYLGYCQEKTMRVEVLNDLPGHRRDTCKNGKRTASGEKHDVLYWQCKNWVEGQDLTI